MAHKKPEPGAVDLSSLPKVSIIIRTKDRPTPLTEAVHSVASQTYPNLQLVIVNDGGLELPIKKIKYLLDLRSFKIDFVIQESEICKGRSHSANTGMSLADGQYFLFLDDDDWIQPEHISNLVDYIEKNQGYIAVYSDTACVSSRDTFNEFIKVYNEDYSEITLAAKNYLPIHSVLFKAEAYHSGCHFDQELDVFEDWHFWLQLASQGDFKRVGGITAYYSAEYSGVGFGKASNDFTEKNALFFRKVVPFLSPKQIAALQYCYREFHQIASYNYKLEQKLEQNTVIQQSLDRLIQEQGHLSAWQQAQASSYQDEIIQLREAQQTSLNEIVQLREAHQNSLTEIDQRLEQLSNVMDHTREMSDIKHLLRQMSASNEEYYNALRNTPLRKAKNIVKHVARKSVTLFRLMLDGDIATIKEKIAYNFPVIRGFFRVKEQHSMVSQEAPEANNNRIINIVTPKHTLFVAELLKKHLSCFGIRVSKIIDSAELYFDDSVHIVIAPQICKKLPGRYIAFQMEQHVSSRWFNESYFNILEHSMAILDYSKRNIKYIQNNSQIHYKQLYYLPISNIDGYFISASKKVKQDNPTYSPDKEYDVVFYGDSHNDRRQHFLNAISEKYNTLIINNIFGKDLYKELSRGKIIVNIHYYEDALLETTRLYEAISLGIPVITESSSDIEEHERLSELVTVTPVNDIEAMLDAIDFALAQDTLDVPEPDDDVEHFQFYLGRALLGCGLITENQVMSLNSPIVQSDLEQGVGLSLPESWERNEEFKQDFPEKRCFPGLRHPESWKGCAMSYAYLSHQAIRLGIKHLEIFEDDVDLPAETHTHWEEAKKIFLDLEFTDKHCDLLSGLLADVSDETKVLDVFYINGARYAIIDRMISAVCNFYGEYPLHLMAKWDYKNNDIHTNTMDRYLESYRLKVLVPLPFIAGHKPEKESTLWSFSNETYDSLIKNSEQKLINKADKYVKDNH